MRIVFMGTPSFAARILESLSEQHEVCAVITRPDAVRSRGKKLEPSPVKKTALELGLPVLEYARLRNNDAFERVQQLAPDVICVAAYGAILPDEFLKLPLHGCINVHASLLPRWRGAAPIERAILAQDEQVGVCIMRMESGLDTGAYCVSRSVPTGHLNAEELTAELSELGAQALLTGLNQLEQGSVFWTEQDEAYVTYAHKIEKHELNLDPAWDAHRALAHVRASSDTHPCKAILGGKPVRIISAELVDQDTSAELKQFEGSLLFYKKKLILACQPGYLWVTSLKPEGKKEMDGASFAAGIQGIKQQNQHWEALSAE